MLLGQGYTQKSDIHSLAMVMWEIIASARIIRRYSSRREGSSVSNISVQTTNVQLSSIPYNECKNQLEVRERVSSF